MNQTSCGWYETRDGISKLVNTSLPLGLRGSQQNYIDVQMVSRSLGGLNCEKEK